MKRSIVIVFVALCCSVAVSVAQNRGSRLEGRMAERAIPTTKEGIDSAVVVRVGDLRNRLALTDKQAVSMISLLRNSYADRAKNTKKFSEMTSEERVAMREANLKTERSLLEIMTDDQKKIYEEYRSSMRQGQGKGRSGSGGNSSGERRGGGAGSR